MHIHVFIHTITINSEKDSYSATCSSNPLEVFDELTANFESEASNATKKANGLMKTLTAVARKRVQKVSSIVPDCFIVFLVAIFLMVENGFRRK